MDTKLDNIIGTCRKYMLTSDNILKLGKKPSEVNVNIKCNYLEKPRETKMTHTSSPIVDKLFWCFFIILNGEHEYEFDNSFKREKDFKIECIEKLRKIKSELKAFGLRLNEIENELLNEKKISIKSLVALCFLYKKNILYVWDRKYFEIINNSDEKINIITNENREDTVVDDISLTQIDFYKDNYWQITSIAKPLKAITSYTKPELLIITQKLDIKDMTIKKTKKELYEKILEKL